MIAVIADDFTGAAEIGGVGLKYGMKVVIATRARKDVKADLFVVAADTRMLPGDKAYSEIEKITGLLLKQKPAYIFKKLDSVLRGNVAAELKAQMKAAQKNRAIVIAANPDIGRTIENGKYFINGVPLAETSFANDPDFPVNSSMVTEIVGESFLKAGSFSAGEEIPKSGIILGNVNNCEEMVEWARRVDNESVIAGSAGFFDVLLSLHYRKTQSNLEGCVELGPFSLIIFGSKYPKTDLLPMGLNEKDTVRVNMPDEIYGNPRFSREDMVRWCATVITLLETRKNVIITVTQQYSTEPNLEERIRKNIAEMVQQVAQSIELTDLLIEGGATTSEILKKLGVKRLFPNRLLRQGIIQMTAKKYPGLVITTKPGSYPWPDNIFLTKNCMTGVDGNQ